jgi:hypothetical protein
MCQLFTSKDFETSLLTLLGVSLVLWRRKADNEHSNPLFYGPLPQNSQHLHFQFPITSLLKILLEVVAIGRKNAGKDSDNVFISIKYDKNTQNVKEKEIKVLKQKLGGLDPCTSLLPIQYSTLTPYFLVFKTNFYFYTLQI